MNMLYEGLKANASIVIVPSTAVETMQLGNIAGLTALAKQTIQERTSERAPDAPPGPWSGSAAVKP
jgi:hypothetical protein